MLLTLLAGMKDILAKHKELGKLSLHFRADESGILSLDGGEAVIETTEEYTVKVRKAFPRSRFQAFTMAAERSACWLGQVAQ